MIPKLDNIFSTFGIPKKIRSDNGPPFNGNEFANFADELGIVHRKVMPLWPEANGEVERFMQTLGKTIRTAAAERKPWQPAVVTFLRNYRATPHPATGRSPAELMFGRANRTKMPDLQHADHVYKERIKAAADERRRTREHNLKVGDKVFLFKLRDRAVHDHRGQGDNDHSSQRIQNRHQELGIVQEEGGGGRMVSSSSRQR